MEREFRQREPCRSAQLHGEVHPSGSEDILEKQKEQKASGDPGGACSFCGHDRLLHDSWGCKTKCGCGVSIIYLTPNPLAQRDEVAEREILKMGNQLDGQVDRLGESHLRELFERAASERTEHGE